MRPPLALLVDGDQIPTTGLAKLVDDLSKQWAVTERIVVRNWRSTKDQQEWRLFSDEHGFRCIQRDPVATGKNAADIELAIITVDLLYAGTDAFCLVTGDMDFTPVVQRIKRAGAHVDWVRPEALEGYHSKGRRGRRSERPGRASPAAQRGQRPAKTRSEASTQRQPAKKAAKKATKKASKKAAPARKQGKKTARQAPTARSPPALEDPQGLAKEVRRIISDLQREGLHERGWVSVNRVGNRLNKDGPWKERYGFPKRRPLHEALDAAGLQTEQTETGAYQARI